jgi:hypothetical protein
MSVRTIAELAVDFCANVLASERKLLAAGWANPAAFREAVYRHGLSRDSFSNEEHQLTAFVLLVCADKGWHPTVDRFTSLAAAADVPVISDWFTWLARETDFNPKSIDLYAETVKRLGDARARIARDRLASLGEVCVDADRFEFHIRERQRAAPKERERVRV